MKEVLTEAIGAVAAVIAAFFTLPQAVRAVRHGTAGVSSATFQILIACATSWAVYAVNQHLWMSLVSNSMIVATILVILGCIKRDGASLAQISVIAVLLLVVGSSITFIEPTWLAWYGGALSICLRWPQVQAIRSAPDVTGVSMGTWLTTAVSNVLWAIYGYLHEDFRLATVCAVVAALSFSLCSALARRRRADTAADAFIASVP